MQDIQRAAKDFGCVESSKVGGACPDSRPVDCGSSQHAGADVCFQVVERHGSRSGRNRLAPDGGVDRVAEFCFLELVQWNRGGVHRLLLNKRASGFDDVEFHKRSGVEIDFGHAGKISRCRRRWSPPRGIRSNGPRLLHGLLPSNPAFCPILTDWLVESRPLGCRGMSTARFLRRPEACGFFPADELSPWK